MYTPSKSRWRTKTKNSDGRWRPPIASLFLVNSDCFIFLSSLLLFSSSSLLLFSSSPFSFPFPFLFSPSPSPFPFSFLLSISPFPFPFLSPFSFPFLHSLSPFSFLLSLLLSLSLYKWNAGEIYRWRNPKVWFSPPRKWTPDLNTKFKLT